MDSAMKRRDQQRRRAMSRTAR